MIVSPSLLRRVPYRIWRAAGLSVRVRVGDRSLVVPVPNGDALENADWRPSWRTEVIRRLAAPGLFVDAGANIGQTLLDLLAARPGNAYAAFEPNSACVAYLNELVSLNGLRDCLIVPAGLSSEAGCRTLYRQAGSSTDALGSVIEDLRPGREFEREVVALLPFDRVRRDLGLGPVGFVKVDVEGAELEVLTGMRETLRECRPPVLCEVLFTDSRADLNAKRGRNAELLRLLSAVGYRVRQIVKTGDLTGVSSTVPVEEFPSEYWTEANRESCDYLLLPGESEGEALARLA